MRVSFQPYLDAPTTIQFHAACAVISVVTGPVAIYRKRRDMLHKVFGYIWVLAMASVAVSAFGIHTFALVGPFSPLHLFAILTIWSLQHGMRAIFRGDVITHKRTFRGLYWNGLMIAAVFNFLPGRTTAASFFGPDSELGLYVVLLGGSFLIARILRKVQFKRSLA